VLVLGFNDNIQAVSIFNKDILHCLPTTIIIIEKTGRY
jgi:hypothetical protein